MTDKRTLRVQLRARRAMAIETTIPVPSAFRARLSPGLTVASYIPIRGEADPSPLARAAVEAGCAILLPHVVDRATPLRFLAWDTEAALAAGPFGLHQPAADATEHVPDIVLTPLVGFDRLGNRLGQGAGHYDRAFARHPGAWRVGVALSVQEVDALAVDPWDMPLHAVATEKEWIMLDRVPS
ncbi:5-formyltetrahydrofolate cyclo-ligase [Sphingomonas bacterium]|uniref:5-formyltetrahydrofolate cyclo-ligase n=1 Tax=Sphingomonas bacterium TaxID=1895847 RepID=UPI0015772BF8|nr:5-formyltetrahydrofolate cyclo-ligase [Sphingomonas bacterium]